MDYKDTLNLKPSPLPQKARLTQLEPRLLEKWGSINIYRKIVESRRGRPKYILHDGPPYANGNIHLGTAMNKIIKDMVVKSKSMAGFLAYYLPGWDCHGLPIEHKVSSELGEQAEKLSKLEIRKRCRAYAEKWVSVQREEFKRLGVFGEWDNPYLTMNPKYQADILSVFGDFVERGSVYRGQKPIHWCTHCLTALAEAEVEYNEHTSPSITVKFELKDGAEVLDFADSKKVYLVIWTTTPWTLPANNAIAMHPEFDYVALDVDGEVLVVADGLKEKFLQSIRKSDARTLEKFKASLLEGKKAIHPLHGRESLVILGDFVTLDAGTGLVHIAPGHGQEDYEVGLKYNLPVYSPVDDRGRFTSDVEFFAGMEVHEANSAINKKLRELGALLSEEKITHSYPHCWRCKNPVIFRSTPQWFISMDKTGLRQKALKAIESVQFIPHWGRQQITGMVAERPDWCISRQRAWGVPITAFYCKCGEVILDHKIIRHVVKIFEREGADAWYAKSEKELLPEGTKCPRCGGVELRKEEDILDVWFDSGVSWAAVLVPNPDLSYPCDLYLEGKDQHRGWFQSSLLASVGARDIAPYRAVMTCGFVIDENDRPYSKSSGNYVPLPQMIEKYGAEIIRMWVASSDYREDVRMSEQTMARLTEAYRKIRNTARFIIANLYDFDPAVHSVPESQMPELDRWALARYRQMCARIKKAYEDFEFHKVHFALVDFCSVDMSAIYLDVLKDRLYVSAPDDPARRASQTALWTILTGMVRLMAPIITFTAEEIWELIRKDDMPESVHVALFPEDMPLGEDEKLLEKWDKLLEVRSAITKALEDARKAGLIGSSQEAFVTLTAPSQDGWVKENSALIKELAIVSGLKVENGDGELSVKVEKSPGKKCLRCWNWGEDVGSHGSHEQICDRCADVLKKISAL